MSDRVTRSRSKDRSPNVSGASSKSRGMGDNTSYRSGDSYSDDGSDDRIDSLLESDDYVDRSPGAYHRYELHESSYSFKHSPKSSPVGKPCAGSDTPSPTAGRCIYPTEELNKVKDDYARPRLRYTPTYPKPSTTTLTEHHRKTRNEFQTGNYVAPVLSHKKRTAHQQRDGSIVEDLTQYLWNLYDEYMIACHFCLVCIVILIVLFIIWPMFFKSSDDKPNLATLKSERGAIVTRFEDEFTIFQSKFPMQSSLLLRTLKAASKSVMREANPMKPGIIMLAGNSRAFDTVDCIARHMVNVTTRAYGVSLFTQITQENLKGFNSYHDVKKYLEDTLRAGFDTGKVGLVHNLESIHGKAAMLFHAFCDNENAPYKDTVIIFTVHVHSDENIADEEEVEAYLDSIWQNDLDIDSRSPLMTRIANFVAIVTPENKSTLDKYC